VTRESRPKAAPETGLQARSDDECTGGCRQVEDPDQLARERLRRRRQVLLAASSPVARFVELRERVLGAGAGEVA
jgi:hypothetical protein